MAYRLVELAREEGLQTGIGLEDGRGLGKYQITGISENFFPTLTDIRTVCDGILGGVNNLAAKTSDRSQDADAGKIKRRLPKIHPYFEMPASAILSITGQSLQQEATPITPINYGAQTESYVTSGVTNYSNYEMQVEFKKRNYFLKPDSAIARKTASYWPVGAAADESIQLYYAEEWNRFTFKTFAPLGDTVSSQFGRMLFFAPDFDTGDEKINGRQYEASPYVHLKNQMLEVTWYQVPYRYIFDLTVDGVLYESYLTKFINRVNQRRFLGCAAGTLLYLGATPTEVYIPPIPGQVFGAGAIFQPNPLFAEEDLLCNAKLRFIYTPRTSPQDYPDDADPFQGNIIPAGHNLFPNFADRNFYFCYTGDMGTPDTVRPAFDSFLFEMLFTDPLLKQPGIDYDAGLN